MTGSDLIVEIPWIIFALAMAVIGLRLRRSRRGSGRPSVPPERQPGERRVGRSEALTRTGDPDGNEH